MTAPPSLLDAHPEVDAGAAPLPGGPAPAASRGRPIHVAFCIDNLNGSGGTELNAVRTAEALDPAEVRVTLVAGQPDGPMRARYERAGIRVVPFSPGGSLVKPAAFAAMRRLARFLAAEGVDVVHCHDKYSNVFAGLAGRLARGPRVVTSKRWWTSPLRHEVLNGIAYRASDRVLVNSAAIIPSLRGVEAVRRDRVVVIPNFVDDTALTPLTGDEARALRARVGVPADAPLVGCVANLHLEKDHATLVRAFAAVAPRHPAWHLVLVGEGSQREPLAALAASLGVGDRLHMPGSIPPDRRPHALFEISTLPSWHEGFPNSVVEALAAGRPVVATRVGGIPELVEDADAGRLVPVGAVEAMAAALETLMRDAGLRAEMGERGRALVRARYLRASVLPRLVGLYRALLAVPAAR